MHEATDGAARCAVLERQVHLAQPEAGAVRGDCHCRLLPAAGRVWQDRGHDLGPERTLAGDRRGRLEAGGALDGPAREAEGDAEAAADAARERGHGEVALVALERLHETR